MAGIDLYMCVCVCPKKTPIGLLLRGKVVVYWRAGSGCPRSEAIAQEEQVLIVQDRDSPKRKGIITCKRVQALDSSWSRRQRKEPRKKGKRKANIETVPISQCAQQQRLFAHHQQK